MRRLAIAVMSVSQDRTKDMADPQSLLLIDRAAFFLKNENTIGTRHQ
jgi:hypothetical protein